MVFGRSKSPPEPTPPPPPPPITPNAAKEQGRVQDQAIKKKGQAAAVVTGGSGLLNDAPTQKPSLLGMNK